MIHFNHNDQVLSNNGEVLFFLEEATETQVCICKKLVEHCYNEQIQLLEDLAIPFSKEIVHHLKKNPVQGTSKSTSFWMHAVLLLQMICHWVSYIQRLHNLDLTMLLMHFTMFW